jgi:hypothetical protein
MQYSIPQGIQVSLDGYTWYNLTDHNRNPLGITYNLIEATDRMANGTLRKYVVARKFVITADWRDLPTLDSNLVDYDPLNPSHGGAWIKAFYEGNAFQPVYVKLTFAKENAVKNAYPDGVYSDSKNSNGQVFEAFMTTFTYDISKRMNNYDYVNLKIEFTEI